MTRLELPPHTYFGIKRESVPMKGGGSMTPFGYSAIDLNADVKDWLTKSEITPTLSGGYEARMALAVYADFETVEDAALFKLRWF